MKNILIILAFFAIITSCQRKQMATFHQGVDEGFSLRAKQIQKTSTPNTEIEPNDSEIMSQEESKHLVNHRDKALIFKPKKEGQDKRFSQKKSSFPQTQMAGDTLSKEKEILLRKRSSNSGIFAISSVFLTLGGLAAAVLTTWGGIILLLGIVAAIASIILSIGTNQLPKATRQKKLKRAGLFILGFFLSLIILFFIVFSQLDFSD